MSGRPAVSIDVIRVFWSQIRAWLVVEEAAADAGASITKARQLFRQSGGVNPFSPAR